MSIAHPVVWISVSMVSIQTDWLKNFIFVLRCDFNDFWKRALRAKSHFVFDEFSGPVKNVGNRKTLHLASMLNCDKKTGTCNVWKLLLTETSFFGIFAPIARRCALYFSTPGKSITVERVFFRAQFFFSRDFRDLNSIREKYMIAKMSMFIIFTVLGPFCVFWVFFGSLPSSVVTAFRPFAKNTRSRKFWLAIRE